MRIEVLFSIQRTDAWNLDAIKFKPVDVISISDILPWEEFADKGWGGVLFLMLEVEPYWSRN